MASISVTAKPRAEVVRNTAVGGWAQHRRVSRSRAGLGGPAGLD